MTGFEGFTSWQAPGADASTAAKLGWLNEVTQDGQNWQKSQRGFKDWKHGLDLLSGGVTEGKDPAYRSRLSGNRLKTNLRVELEGLGAIKPMWGYHAAKAYASYAEVLNRTARALYLANFWDQAVKEALAYAMATCAGWVRPVYARDHMGRGKGSIQLLTYGMPCVLPFQMPSNGNFQEAYAVTLLDEMPVYMAHAKWPAFQDRLRPTSSKYWYSSDIRSAAKGNGWKTPMSFFRRKDGEGMNVYVPIRWTTLLDLSINETGGAIRMGQPGSSWEYIVPAYGSEIPDGMGGVRRADENDARLYPNRRLIISSDNCVMYDGPAFNWHGQLDLIPFFLDKWPWEPMGLSAVQSGYEIQSAVDEIDRGCMNKLRALMNLPLGYPIGGVTQGEAEAFDPFEPGARVGYDEGNVEKPFQLPVPPEVYRIEPELMAFREKLIEEMDYQTQTRDIVELGKARALGKGMDQLEALIAANGPLVRGISRSMESGLGRIGEQVGYIIPQYMTTGQLIQYAEPETMSMEVFDYNPGSLVPSHLPDDVVHGADQQMIPSRHSAMERAKWFAGNVKFVMMPHSAHEITQMTHRLMLMQLRQRQYPISAATVMEACEVQNTARPAGNSEQDRFWTEKEEELTRMTRIKAEAEGFGLAPAGGGKGSGPKGGRPSTLQQPPKMEQKGDGRPVVSTSP